MYVECPIAAVQVLCIGKHFLPNFQHARSAVKSFGTEDRNKERHIPASSTLYSYIVFKAADIKDLQVEEPTVRA